MLLNIDSALQIIEKEVRVLSFPKEPANLYEPVKYILSNGGKRIRPALVLLACNMFSDDYMIAVKPALAVEMFHNFTLLHDDLMDNSSIRRGKPAVHKKWDENIAILSGDVMSVLSWQLISQAGKDIMPELFSVLNKTAIEVCEGQMMDMDFEKRSNVSVDEYIKMIGLKTSVLLAASLMMGAIAGGADKKAAGEIYEFGFNLGIGFQLQDDLLDTFGDIEKFGKKIGNDILTNKKTYLYLKALELSNMDQREQLLELYSRKPQNSNEKIRQVKDIFLSLGIKEITEDAISNYFSKASEMLEGIFVPAEKKLALKEFSENIMKRDR